MLEFIFKTSNDWTGLILRLTAGIIMLPHGLQKVSPLFGGYGFKATMEYFTTSMKLPWIVSLLVVLIELLGSIGLITGAFSKVWAMGLICVMGGAIITTNFKNGLFMNWYGSQSGEGYEYHLLFIGLCIAIILNGSGKFSIDHKLFD